jgi:hypothetical protein
MDGSCQARHDGLMSTSQGRARWASLPADERQRREAQSAADSVRAGGGPASAGREDGQRRAAQSRADRELADALDAIHETVYGGDINMMDRHDW